MNIVLAVDGPLDAAQTLARYRNWGEDPANRVDGAVFRRVLRLAGRLVPYEVTALGTVDDARLAIHAPGARSTAAAEAITAEVRTIFGLPFDLPTFYRMAKSDAALAGLVVPLHGLRPTLAPTALEMLVGSITAQQVNLTFAFALRASLVRRYGTPVSIGDHVVYAFPEASALARATPDELRAMKFSGQKTEYIRTVASAVADGAIDLEELRRADNDTVIERLTAFRGLGRWTAEWFLARCLGRGDVCPAGDLGVHKAFDHYYGRGRSLSDAAIRRRALGWGIHQNVAIHYLLAGMRLGRPLAGGGA